MPPLTQETIAAIFCAGGTAISLIVIAVAHILDARWTVLENSPDYK